MHRCLRIALPISVALAGACSSVNQGAPGGPADRVLTTNAQGEVIRQSALNDRARIVIAASPAKVWPALVATYAELGIEANFADQAHGRYGAQNYAFPRTLKGERIGTFFSCGSSLTGAVVDAGTLTAQIITTLSPADNGQTAAVMYVSGIVRRNEGTSTGAADCLSSGRLEEMIRVSLERKVAAM